ncbi:MAG: monovalent cation/H+ antiporter complex subunit F [Acidimicrobiales bacterium]
MIAIVAIGCFGFAALCATYRLLRGPELPDRVAALDVALVSFMGAIAVDGARRDDTTFFILLVVIAIVGFTATVATSRFVEQQGVVEADGDRSPPTWLERRWRAVRPGRKRPDGQLEAREATK